MFSPLPPCASFVPFPLAALICCLLCIFTPPRPCGAEEKLEENREEQFEEPNGEEAIERRIEAGLRFLAKYQAPDGSWSLHTLGDEDPDEAEVGELVSDSAATGLALMAFQGAGYSRHTASAYQSRIRKGIEFLLRNQQENGDLYVPQDRESNGSVWLYSHAIASIALCKDLAQSQNLELENREIASACRKAIDFLLAAQNAERGGWRYEPGVSSDLSVTAWCGAALRSAEQANLKIPREARERLGRFLDACQASPENRQLYRYNPLAPESREKRHGREVSPAMTAVGLVLRLETGWQTDHPDLIAGADFLHGFLPAHGSVASPQRDAYYWYYGTLLMQKIGGDHAKEWNAALLPVLLEEEAAAGTANSNSSEQGASSESGVNISGARGKREGAPGGKPRMFSGSWSPARPVADRFGVSGGRFYVTVMHLLTLELTRTGKEGKIAYAN